jgi:signal transduction histidine kinase/CheY-like chemotaxis protein
MMRLKDMPLRQKLMASILATSILVIVLMQAAYFALDLFAMKQSTVQQLATLGKITAANSTAALAFQNQKDAEEVLASLKAEPYVVSAAIYDQNGALFTHYPSSTGLSDLPRAPGAAGYRLDQSYLAGFQPMVQSNRELGALYLKFDAGTLMREWWLNKLKISALIVLVVLILAYALSRALQNTIARPILGLADTAKEISERRDFSIRATKYGDDEIGHLSDTFNEVLSGIQERERALQSANDELRTQQDERDRAQQQLARVQKMEAVGQLTGGLAHDFNNILGAVIANLDIVKENVAPGSLEETCCSAAIDASLSAAELVKRMLAFSRRQPLHPKPIDLADVIASMLPLLKRALGEQVRIVAVPLGNGWLAMADSDQVESAILNLAINARDAMPSGGVLRIEQSNFTVDDASSMALDDLKTGDYAVLRITDTGTGMPPEVVARAFDPFFTTKAPGAGSGLGLSMVIGTMKQLGGTARIYSEEGVGTAVQLYMPRAQVSAAKAIGGSDTSAESRGGRERILMVEDNPQIREAGERILRGLGYDVLLAENGDEALRLIDAGQSFDLLFSDVVMAGSINGISLARELRVRRPKTRILLTSGFTSPTMAEGDLAGLGVELIGKPYRKSDLATRLRALLDVPAET